MVTGCKQYKSAISGGTLVEIPSRWRDINLLTRLHPHTHIYQGFLLTNRGNLMSQESVPEVYLKAKQTLIKSNQIKSTTIYKQIAYWPKFSEEPKLLLLKSPNTLFSTKDPHSCVIRLLQEFHYDYRQVPELSNKSQVWAALRFDRVV